MPPTPDPPALADPATTADERTTLTEFLDYYRGVLERKLHGLDEDQARVHVAASTIDLLGLVRHMAEVERWWFRQVFIAEVTTGIFGDHDPDIDWHHTRNDTVTEALGQWRAEVERSREIVATTASLDTIASFGGSRRGDVSLRWILVHMIEEYARHCGHADLLREAADGQVGD